MEIVAALIGLLGVAVGFGLNELSSWLRRRAEAKQKSKSVRRFLQLEIEQNLFGLLEVINRLEEQERAKRGPTEVVMPQFLASMSVPTWSTQVWQSQIAFIPDALNILELQRAYDFYSDLECVNELIRSLADNEQQVTYRMELYERCASLLKQIAQEGSPLGIELPK